MPQKSDAGTGGVARSIGAEAVWVAIVAVLVLGVVFVIMMWGGVADDQIAGAFGVFATPIVSIVTAYFGIRATSQANQALAKRTKEVDDVLASLQSRPQLRGQDAPGTA